MVAVDAQDRGCLLRQFRHAAGGWIDELPAGKLEGDDPPLACAQRELAEEAGMHAGHWTGRREKCVTQCALLETREPLPSPLWIETSGVLDMANRARTTQAGGARDIGAGRGQAPDEAPQTKRGAEQSGSNPDPVDTAPGQLGIDDRGNISWEWADDPELLADDIVGNTARLRALAPADLELADDDIAAVDRDMSAIKQRPIAVRKLPQKGYNPYNSGEPTKQSWKKKRDLRQLGKWLELKKRMRNKPD